MKKGDQVFVDNHPFLITDLSPKGGQKGVGL